MKNVLNDKIEFSTQVLVDLTNYITIERNFWKYKALYLNKDISKEQYHNHLEYLFTKS